MEISFCGADFGKYEYFHFNLDIYKEIGKINIVLINSLILLFKYYWLLWTWINKSEISTGRDWVDNTKEPIEGWQK